jgi:hypothetical protein
VAGLDEQGLRDDVAVDSDQRPNQHRSSAGA